MLFYNLNISVHLLTWTYFSLVAISDDQDDGWTTVDGRKALRPNLAKTIYSYTGWCWVLLALASLALQATRTVDVGETHELLMYYGELGITMAFDIEIILRVLATLPDWRSFFSHGNNWLDTILAIGSSVIQIPIIHNSSVYPWFTIFQLARFYRVILVVPRMKPLLVRQVFKLSSNHFYIFYFSSLFLATCMV